MNRKRSLLLAGAVCLLSVAFCACGPDMISQKEEKKETETNTEQTAGTDLEEDELDPIDVNYVFEDDGALHITSVKGLIEALANGGHVEIDLAPGTYDLSSYLEHTTKYDSGTECVNTYAVSEDGKQLMLGFQDDICIRGAKDKKTEIVTGWRYADVLFFSNCTDIRLEYLTFGHAVEEGYCEGAVLGFASCSNVTMKNVDLYGCGTYGIEAMNCSDITVWDSRIHNCTYGILDLYNCFGIHFDNTQFDRCKDLTMLDIFYSSVTFQDCAFENNKGNRFLSASGNSSLLFENCSFDKWETKCLASEAAEVQGVLLGNDCHFDGNQVPETVTFVSNVKELVEAIEPGARIRLKRGSYNLTDYISAVLAENGGTIDSDYVRIEEVYDGMQLSIKDVSDLSIAGGADLAFATKLVVEPRYATVLTFEDCDDLFLSDLTLGHTDMEGTCAGNVINLDDCRNVFLHGLDLYGCGYVGLETMDVRDLLVMDCVIHDCNGEAMWHGDTEGTFTFLNSTFTDCQEPIIFTDSQADITFRDCTFGAVESEIEYDEGITLDNCIYNYYDYDWEYEEDDEGFLPDIYSLDLVEVSMEYYDFSSYQDYWYGYEFLPYDDGEDENAEVLYYPSYRINIYEDGTGVLIHTDTDEEETFTWKLDDLGRMSLTMEDGFDMNVSYYANVAASENSDDPEVSWYLLRIGLKNGDLWFY